MGKIIKLKRNNLKAVVLRIKKVLEADGLVVLPSDTVYGLAANAYSLKAVQKVYDFKGRRFGRGLSVFLKDFAAVKEQVFCRPDQEAILKTLLPGPFTVILRSKHRVAKAVEPEDGTLGIRLIEHLLVERLTRAVDFPVIATSANLSGNGPHYSVPALLKTLSQSKQALIDLVVDAGPLPLHPVSTVVRLVDDQVKVLREGALNLRVLLKKETQGEAGTRKLAQEIFRTYFSKALKKKAAAVIMKGDLGAGKTVFAKGVGDLFGLALTSPTFVLLDEARVNQPPLKTLYHLDLFRLENEAEIEDLELKQFFKKGNLILMEWGEKLAVFESLKTEETAFYLLQLEEKGIKKRLISLYQI